MGRGYQDTCHESPRTCVWGRASGASQRGAASRMVIGSTYLKLAWASLCIVVLMAGAARAQMYGGFDGGFNYDPYAIAATVEEAEALFEDAGGGEECLGAAKALVEACQAVLTREQRRTRRVMERMWLMYPREERE